MNASRLPTSVKFFFTYLVVFAVILGWWLVLQVSTRAGAPVVTVLVSYAVPLAGWFAVQSLVGAKSEPS